MSPGVRKPTICICENKDADQLHGYFSAKLISAFVFATWIVQYIFFQNTKFQASSHIQWLYSLVCVRPCQNPNCWCSHAGAQNFEVEMTSLFCTRVFYWEDTKETMDKNVSETVTCLKTFTLTASFRVDLPLG